MLLNKLLLRFFFLLVVVLVVIPCVQKGMFLDGINYANVANNLANGKGNLWYFTYSETFLSHYTHQLPFMLWCQALFYWLFGNSTMVERGFCLLLLLLNSYAISKLWRLSFPQYKSFTGLPLILWIVTPIVFWGFTNNVQEMMMSLCAIASISYLLRYYEKGNTAYLLIGGLLCFLCAFCKGIQGLFPLAAIVIHNFTIRRKTFMSVIKDQFWFTLPVIICSTLLWIYRPAREMLISNFNDRLKSTFISDIQDTTGNRFELWGILFMDLLVPIGLCILLCFIFKIKPKKVQLNWQNQSLFFLAIGLAASLPLIVTLEQRRFYLITSIPFFAIALGGIIAPSLRSIVVSKRVYKAVNFILIGMTSLAIIYATINHQSYKRDEALLSDVHAIGELVSEQTISADVELMFHYSLVAYLARHYNLSLDFGAREEHLYHISHKEEPTGNYMYLGKSYHLEALGKN